MAGDKHVPFQIIINCLFKEISLDASIQPIENKYSLCLVNDFEDGAWRIDSFMEYIWDNIAETALSAAERKALGNRPSSLLSKAAKNLRITNNDVSGGEIAEILLYAIMRNYYGALSVVPKIFYKQNANDFAKGADSVHILLESDGSFSLWLGEAKFYNSLTDARLDKIVESVHDTLTTDKIKKENSIVVGLKDLDNIGLQESTIKSIKELLDRDTSIDKLKPHLHIPILLLHECDETAKVTEISVDYVSALRKQYAERATSYFTKQINRCSKDIHLYSEVTFHLILFPVPKKTPIVTKFVERAKVYR